MVVDDATAGRYAEVREEASNDLWIAALVRQHGLPLLSRDGHFDLIAGLKRIGW